MIKDIDPQPATLKGDFHVVPSFNNSIIPIKGVEGVTIMAKPRVPKKTSDDTSLTPAVEAVSNGLVAAETNGNGSANGGTKLTTRKKIAAKPEIVKVEQRANLVPINLEDEIRRLAYLLAERRGFEPGHEAEDWLTAEHEVRQRYHQQSA